MVEISHFSQGSPLEIGSSVIPVEPRTWLLEDHFAHAVKISTGRLNFRIDIWNIWVLQTNANSCTFLACLQSQPLTCSRAETVSGASQNLVIGPPEFFGWSDAIFVIIDSVWSRPDSAKLSTQTSNQTKSLSLKSKIKKSLHFKNQ